MVFLGIPLEFLTDTFGVFMYSNRIISINFIRIYRLIKRGYILVLLFPTDSFRAFISFRGEFISRSTLARIRDKVDTGINCRSLRDESVGA